MNVRHVFLYFDSIVLCPSVCFEIHYTEKGGIAESCHEYIKKLDINDEDLDRSTQLSRDKDSESETDSTNDIDLQ